MPTTVASPWRPIVSVFLPFSAGYFLSYFFRTINAVIATSLTNELGLTAAELGLMTAVYFLTFAAMQLPLGVLLDRYGPKRVQGILLLIAAFGAALFAATNRFETLLVARALIGLGAAGALVAGLKAIVLCFSKGRVPLLNGCFVMAGTLGAVAATSPANWVLTYLSWRALFGITAVVTAVTSVIIFAVVPDLSPPGTGRQASRSGGLARVFRDPRFWRLAPLSTMCVSTAWAMQGLWAEQWLVDVAGLDRTEVVHHLLAMAIALSAGALLLGLGADRLRPFGIQPGAILVGAALLFLFAELTVILGLWPVSYWPWALIAGMGAATVLSYSILADHFPKEMAGQANAALNVFHIGGAFAIQEFIGRLVDLWPAHSGHYPAIGYKSALALLIGGQLVALIWFGQFDQKLRSTLASALRS